MLNACSQLRFQDNDQIEESTTHEGGKKKSISLTEFDLFIYLFQIVTL